MPETRRLIRPRPAEEYEEAPAEPQRRLRREEPATTLRSSRPHPSDEPATRRGSRRAPAHDDADDDRGLAVAKGWGGYKRTKANAPSPWAKLYKVKDEEDIIMFLEDGPYASFLQHWCEWMPRGQKQSYVCLQDGNCPLDKVDPKPQARVRFNVLDCGGDTPILVAFETGVTVTEALEEYSQDEPLSGRYFAVAMRGTKNNRRTQIRPVKIRDLKEDWDFDPLTEEEVAQFDDKLWDDSSLDVNTRAELQKVADAFNE
jgi:hypothetical protein